MAANKTVVLVTGATSGIGLETVAEFSKASPTFHVLMGCRSVEKGDKLLKELHALPGILGAITLVQIDVTDAKSVEAARSHIEEKFGKLDVLINNAGVLLTAPMETAVAMRQTFETNVVGSAVVTEAMEPLLRKSSQPRVIFVSSGMGSVSLRLDPDGPFKNLRGEPYRVSKAALNMLAACYRFNTAEWGCKVLAFDPGWCVSNLTGEKGREMRIKGGARDAKDPAKALVDIVTGKRPGDFDKNGLVDLDGKVIPW